MKGVLLVTVGAILIWLGLSGAAGKDSLAREPGDTDQELAQLEDPGADLPRLEAQPVAQEPEWDSESGSAAPPEPSPKAAEAMFAPLGEDPSRKARQPSQASLDRPQSQPSPAPAAKRVFELMKPAGDPEALAEVLLEAWLAGDQMPLQDHLNGEFGVELADDQRDLVGAFWQALLGRADVAGEVYERLRESDAVTSAQLELLGAGLVLGETGVVPTNSGRRDALARSMRMVLLDASARKAVLEGRHDQAARDLSELIHAELAAPWAPHRAELYTWAEALRASQLQYRLDQHGDWPAVKHMVRNNESLVLIRKRVMNANPGLRTCTGLIARVNGVGKYIHPGDLLRIPTDVPNMLVDLDARIAIYRHGSEAILAWPIGIGRKGHETPIGSFEVGLKQSEPAWHRVGYEALPYGDPENLLGSRWLGWHKDGKPTSFGFHGTNDPDGVGGRVSAGCIRMRDEDVEELFELLPLYSRVVVQP